MRSPLLPALLFFLGLAGGCNDELTARGVGTCGNHVIDDDYEDCDGFSILKATATCLPPGVQNACRLTCEPSKEGEPPLQCPSGWSCGTDKICRRPSGKVEPLVSPISADAQSLRLGDFDADGNLDVLAVGSAGLTIFYFERNGVLGSTLSLPTAGGAPAVGDLTDDKAADLALPVAAGLGVLRGQKNRTINPASYSTYTVNLGEEAAEARVIAIDALSKGPVEDEFMLLYSPTSAPQTVRVARGSRKPGEPPSFKPIFDLPLQTLDAKGEVETALDLLQGELPVGDLKTGNECEEFVVGFSGQSTIGIYSPCSADGDWSADSTTAQVFKVTLPVNQTLAGRVFLVDVNGDGHLDLVFGVKHSVLVGRCYDVHVSYGLPDGTFDADASSLPLEKGDGLTTELKEPAVDCEKETPLVVLAAGDINRDKCPDIVTADEIFLSTSDTCTSKSTRIAAGIGSAWTDARIADFNANGLLDVVAVAEGSRNFDFYNTAPSGKLNRFTIPTQREVRQITVGDFDGDLVTDLAFNDGTQGSSDSSLSIAFGRLAGAPEIPITAGVYSSVSQLISGDFSLFGNDAISDLAVLSSDPSAPSTYPLSLLAGSSSRQMLAPLIITNQGETVFQAPLLVAIGDFGATTGESGGHPDVVALTAEVNESPGGGNRIGLAMIPAEGDAQFNLNAQVSMSPSLSSGTTDTYNEFKTLFTGMNDAGFFSVNLHAAHLGSESEVGDDLILTTSSSGSAEMQGGALRILRVEGDQWSIAQRVYLEPGAFYPGGVRSADIDGNGKIDLAGILVTFQLNGANVEEYTTQLDVFLNQGPGQDGNRYALERKSLALTGEQIVDFALMDLNDSSGKDFALATDEGILVASLDKGSLELKVDKKLLSDVPVGALASGDITGDGVEDLIIAQGASVVFYKGKPELE